MRTGPRRLGIAGVAVAAVLLLAGCDALGLGGLTGGGGGAISADPAAAVLGAADTTAQAGSSRFSITSNTTGGGQDLQVSGEGLFDYAAQRGSITMNMTGIGETTTIIDGGVVYQQMPAQQAAQLGGSWIRIDTAAITGTEPGAQQGGNSDPSAAMDWLRGASNQVTEVGQEDVRGDQTTHYKVTLDLQKAAQAGGGDAASQQALLNSLSTTTIPADVWIDGEGRMRRMSYGMDLNAAGQAVSSSVTVELWDFGVAVDVTPPPENEIVDFDEVLSGLTDALETAPVDPNAGAVDPGAGVDTQNLDELQQQLQEETERLRQEIERAAGEG